MCTEFHHRFIPALVLASLAGCSGGPGQDQARTVASDTIPAPLFTEVPAERSGMEFTNRIVENNEVNYFVYEYLYNGGGVAIGDLDNDGRPDIYLTGNMVPDRLYLNRGDLHFEDVTARAIPAENGHGWHSGVTLADVNGDGWNDLYVCRAGWYVDPLQRSNLFYLNNGDGTFREAAAEWGIADTTRSTQAAFFDMDKDGDLDLYVLNAPLQRKKKLNNVEVEALVRAHRSPTDRLYRNDGGHFTDVTAQAGVWNMGYGLGLAVSDLDGDGWDDIYVANDYIERDMMYLNQHDGTFKEVVRERTRHISNYGMGCDAADFNNDGLPDIMVLDMVSEDHVRSKKNMGAMSTERFWQSVKAGYHLQYMFNTLQLNNGNGTFSEIAQLAGISKTDWSWAPLFADLDNDGWKDLLITNGYKRDMRDNDYNRKAKEIAQARTPVTPEQVLQLVPSTRIRNYFFRNNGDLTFSNVSQQWGFTAPMNSNGAAFGDLDGDGDLDIVVNNMDSPVSVLENHAVGSAGGHYLRVALDQATTAMAIGAKVRVRTANGEQFAELMPTRGYASSVEPVLHFGIGGNDHVEEVIVTWPDGRISHRRDIAADQVLHIDRSDAATEPAVPGARPLLTEVAAGQAIPFTHRENTYDDFAVQVLLPHKESANGPFLAVADVNGDGNDDVFVGGARGQAGALFLGDGHGFRSSPSHPWNDQAVCEDLGAYFFDADGDADPDLLVVSGSNETDQAPENYQSRLYRNDGHGGFAFDPQGIAPTMTSGQRAAIGDADGDGDLDIFLGGRIIPGRYPAPPRSYLLLNDGAGHFADATQERAPDLAEVGMITDAAFLDYDQDGDQDLVVLGEWMPIRWFNNDRGHFASATGITGLDDLEGWWDRLVPADLDGDGDLDLVCGNIGWNNKFHGTTDHPLELYSADFDNNGRSDIVLAKAQNDVLYPVRGRECSSQQCGMIKDRFPTYDAFAHASITDIYGPEKVRAAQHLLVRHMRSCTIMNDGQGRFRVLDLPNAAQMAPLNGIAVLDIDGDGRQDIIAAGNHWGAEVETIRYDGGTGIVLLGDGQGGFRPLSIRESGLFAWGDVKDLAVVHVGAERQPWIVIANNNDALQMFRPNISGRLLTQR
ncbi:MAG: VCBS repeat-containing protein [Flavobacteriales bacterium]|nr:VCBS repeat-containing protein [Flavobacteriales bacterium]MCB9166697.1 VCBS repeat-containing protein [Flavobacteriales bacterium]